MLTRFAGVSILLFGTATYFTYKFQEARRFKELYFDLLPDKRQFMLTTHQNAAYNFDKAFDQYENVSKIVCHLINQTSYRKTILSMCRGKILETGVGTSRNLPFYPPGSQVTAVDWSSNSLEVALLKPATNIEIQYRLEDVEEMSFPDDSFDTVVDTFGMEYYLEPGKVLQEMKRVCKKGMINFRNRGGQILLLTTGRSDYDLLNIFQELKQAKYLKSLGQFPNRDWENIIVDPELKILQRERKINGTVYFYIIENNKN